MGVGSQFRSMVGTTTVGRLDISRAAIADGDFAGFDDDGHLAPAVGQLEHGFQLSVVLQYVDELKRNLAVGVRLPGAPSVRSKLLTVDQYFFCHRSLRC